MHPLRSEGQLSLSVKPICCAPQNTVKICYLNARSLHKHSKDICTDMNYTSTDVNIFVETRFIELDNDDSYLLSDDKYNLFRNDAHLGNLGGTALYSRLDYYPGYPYCNNRNSVEITILRFMVIPHVTIVGIFI